MTVQSFILLYNKTFDYILERYGKEALEGLWDRLSGRWCRHLDELVAAQGIRGMEVYWGGDGGTLSREKALYSTRLEDGVFSLEMHDCPSVGEIVSHGAVPLHKALSYCDHCPALYVPIAERNGCRMDYTVEYNPDGTCSGRCRLVARKAEPRE